MNAPEQYVPGPASGAQVAKKRRAWTLILAENSAARRKGLAGAYRIQRNCASGLRLKSITTWLPLETR